MVNITSDFLKAFGPEIGVAYGNGFPNSIVTSPQIKISNDSSQEALPVHMSYWFFCRMYCSSSIDNSLYYLDRGHLLS